VFAALAGLGVVLAAWALRLQGVPGGRPSTAAVARALRNRRFVGGLLLMSLPALLFGVLGVLGPLHLAAAGWGAAAIGAVWLCSAALESLQAPLVGRLIDRRGRLLPVRVSLVGSVLCSIGLATGARPMAYVPLIVFSGLMYGALFTPAFALIAEGAERSGLPQGMAFGLMNAAWASGALIGPAAGGAIATASGDVVPFVVAAAFCATALAAARRARHRTTAVALE
jgi:MFS family permease